MPHVDNEELLMQETLNLLIKLQLHSFIKQENIKKEKDQKVIEVFKSFEELRKAQITELNTWLEKISQDKQTLLRQNELNKFILNFKNIFNLQENPLVVEEHLSSSFNSLQAAFDEWQKERVKLVTKYHQTVKPAKDAAEKSPLFMGLPVIGIFTILLPIVVMPAPPVALVLVVGALLFVSVLATCAFAIYKASRYENIKSKEQSEYQAGSINAKTDYERKRDNIFSALNRPENSVPSAGAVVERAPSNIRAYPNLFVTSNQQSNDRKSADNTHSGPTP